MSDRDKILDKIKKCLALSASSNEHEAEAALRQARKMMEANGITDLDIRQPRPRSVGRSPGPRPSPLIGRRCWPRRSPMPSPAR